MSLRRKLLPPVRLRLTKIASTTWQRLLALLLLGVLVTGCRGGLRHESWPGLLSHDGTLYAANLEQVQAVNAETGKVYWSFPPEDDRDARPFYSTPQIVPDVGEHGMLIVAGFKDQIVYGLALGESVAERPDELWRFGEASGQYVGSGTIAGDLFIIGNGDGKVYALDVADGRKAWDYQTDDRVWAKPLVVDDVVYAASLDHSLYALDLETGQERWRFEADGSLSASPIYAGGDVWIGDFASNLYRIDLETQDAVWRFRAEDWLWATPVERDGVLYFADVSGHVYALDIESETLIWDEPAAVEDVVHGRPVLNPEGDLLYVAGFELGTVHAISTETGSIRASWGTTQRTPGRLPGDLVTDGERLYAMPIMVATRIQAYALDSGEILWSTPEAE